LWGVVCLSHSKNPNEEVPVPLLFNGHALDRNDLLLNPQTNTNSFGYISNLKGSSAGHIVLKWGEHVRQHKGFGCIHIWQQHGTEAKLKKHCSAIEDIPNLINKILIPGTQILDTGKNRPAVVRSSVGTIILECPTEYRDYYSIVTLYFTNNIRGIVIGSIGREPIQKD